MNLYEKITFFFLVLNMSMAIAPILAETNISEVIAPENTKINYFSSDIRKIAALHWKHMREALSIAKLIKKANNNIYPEITWKNLKERLSASKDIMVLIVGIIVLKIIYMKVSDYRIART